MNKVKLIKINTSDLLTAGGNRSISVLGDENAVVSIQVSRGSDGRFYDFTTTSFTADYTSSNRITNKALSSAGYKTLINFPASATTEVYTVKVWAEPHFDTIIDTGGANQKTKVLWQETITQNKSNTTLTFVWEYGAKQGISALLYSGIGNLGSLEASFKGVSAANAYNVDFDTTLTTTEATADAGVLFIDADKTTFGDEVLFWQTGATTYETTNASTDASSVSATVLELDTVEGLYVGMYVNSIESQSHAVNKSYISSIDTETKLVTLNVTPGAWGDEKNIVFNAYGASLIKSASGININPGAIGSITLEQESTTVRTEVTSNVTSLDVKGTTGIGIGATVRNKNLNMSTSSDPCTITDISTQSTSAGTIDISNGQFQGTAAYPLRVNTIVYIDGSSRTINIKGTIKVIRNPFTDQNIYVDLTKVLKAGTA